MANRGSLITELLAIEHRLTADIRHMFFITRRWLLVLIASQCIGTAGIIVAIFLKH